MTNMNDQPIKEIKVIGVEKPQKGKFQEHFVSYIICHCYDKVIFSIALKLLNPRLFLMIIYEYQGGLYSLSNFLYSIVVLTLFYI
jgi:hypothetical protein